jgi:L-seryl-tRNA(Ser) seleniumtransferase
MDPRSSVNPDPRRLLPSVSELSRRVAALRPELPLWVVTEAARRTVAGARSELESRAASLDESSPRSPDWPEAADWVALVEAAAERLASGHPRRVVNATGVVLHTNLGRAPLAPAAARAAAEAATGYSDLELDLSTGKRGERLAALAEKLVLLSGAEAAFACNNNAAALLLALDTLARGREVVVSRGELIEIGGSFRVPDIMERAGVRLVEVGTTNRTHARDYERAIGPETGLLLKVHRSNFDLTGFVAEVDLAALVRIGRARGLPVVEDLGSGTLVDLTDHGLPAEAFAPARVRLGADLVCFSGDKLLGGPQAGIVLGGRKAIAAMRGNPLARALRLDKMTLAALDWTLAAMLGGRAEREIPVLRQILEPLESVESRARALAAELAGKLEEGVTIEAVPDRSPVGGGSLPGFRLDTWVVAIRSRRPAAEVAAALRGAAVPILARVRDDALLLDLRTLGDDDARVIEAGLVTALR